MMMNSTVTMPWETLDRMERALAKVRTPVADNRDP
jgi:hypothetical protein